MKHDIGISPDSASYILAAKNFSNNYSFYETTSQPLVEWPFGYPLILSILNFILNTRFENCAFILNIILFSANFILALKLLSEIMPKNKGTWWFNFAYFGFPTIYVYAFAWSEPLFNFLVLVFSLFFVRYLKTEKDIYLGYLSLITAAMVITRYAGIFFLIGTFFSLLLKHLNDIRKKFFKLIAFVTPSTLMISIWFLRNYLLTKTIAGPREELGIFTYSKNLFDLVDQTIAWFIPHKLPPLITKFITDKSEVINVPLLPRLLIFASVVIFLAYLHSKVHRRTQSLRATKNIDFYVAIPLITYFLFIYLTSTRVYFETSRFFSPIYPILMIYIARFLSTIFDAPKEAIDNRIKKLVIVFLFLHSFYFPLSSYFRIISYYQSSGLGINDTSFQYFIKRFNDRCKKMGAVGVVTDNPSLATYIAQEKNLECFVEKPSSNDTYLVILFKPHSKLEDYLKDGSQVISEYQFMRVRFFFANNNKRK
ncbi:MAG: hypothetical protein N3E37_04805 [Candidatus Micrarchaeota archaeon]|nr:hypothetical protein [Candidatus Micrarchaeota archaeon]